MVVPLMLGGFFEADFIEADRQAGTADVSRVFSSWTEWQHSYNELVSALAAFETLCSQPVDSAADLLALLQARDHVYRVAGRVEGYLYLRLQLDGADEEARSREQLTDETDQRWWSRGDPSFTMTITDLGEDKIAAWIAEEEDLRPYGFFFRRFFDSNNHPWPEDQSDLQAFAGAAGRQSSRIYKALAIVEAPAVKVSLESGERLEIHAARARNLGGELVSAVDRSAAYQAWLESLGKQSQTYAALLEGIVERETLIAEARGFESALEAKLHRDAIAPDVVRNVIQAARERSAVLHRYHSIRQRALGLDEYGLADRMAPMSAETTRPVPLAEARDLILDASALLGSEVQNLVQRAFDERWIDSVERPAKRANAGATFVAGHPFVLIQYRGTLENLFQLAHEIGHAVHAALSYRYQPYVYHHPSTLTAETVASVFEGILVDEMVRRASSESETVQALDLSIQSILRLFYRPSLDADFELRLYEENVAITGPALGELYIEVVRAFYGDSVEFEIWDAHRWQMTPHYYTSPLYMGRYGLSAAAANVLLSRLTRSDSLEAERARARFLSLLRSGSSDYPLNLLAGAGADLGDAETLATLFARMESLVNKLGRSIDQR